MHGRVVGAAIIASVLAACAAPSGGGSAEPPASTPSIEGRVQSTVLTREVPSVSNGNPDGVVSAAAVPGGLVPAVVDDGACGASGCSVMVVAAAGSNGLDRASVHIPPGARVLVTEGGQTRAGRHEDVQTGSRVRVWFTGPVAESYPVQATAGTVLVLSGGETGGQRSSSGRAVSHGGPVRDHVSLVDGLRAKGFTVTPAQSAKQPFLSVEGTTLSLSERGTQGKAAVQSYEYKDARAAERDASKIGPDGSTMRTMVVDWAAPPHFYLKERVLVLYVGNDATVLKALSELLGPQIAGQ